MVYIVHIFGLVRGEFGVTQEFREAKDCVDRSPDFMADHRKEFTLGSIGGFRGIFGFDEGGFRSDTITDIVAHRLIF